MPETQLDDLYTRMQLFFKNETGDEEEYERKSFGLRNAIMLDIFAGELENIFNRADLIYSIECDKFNKTIHDCKRELARVKDIDLISQKSKEILEIPAFFELIELFQNVSDFPSLFEKGTAPKYQDTLKTLPFTLSKKLEKREFGGKITEISKFCGLYNEKTLTDYLTSLHEALAEVTQPVVLILDNIRHSIVLSRIPKVAAYWELINPDKLTLSDISTRNIGDAAKIAKKIIDDFSGGAPIAPGSKPILSNDFIACSTTVYGHESRKDAIKLSIDSWQEREIWQKIHIVSPENSQFTDAKAVSLLHIAAFIGDNDKVKALLQNGANVNAVANDFEGTTPLCAAASRSHLKTVKILLNNKADVNQQEGKSGKTAVWYASHDGNFGMVEQLIKEGADLKIPDKDRRTPALVAFEKGSFNTLACLEKHGATINDSDFNGYMLLRIAMKAGNLESIKYFIQSLSETLKIDTMNQCNENGETLLFISAGLGHLDLVQYFKEQGSDINQINNEGATALHNAVYGGFTDVVHYLVDNGANINAATVSDENTPLHTAAYEGHADIIQCLLVNHRANRYKVTCDDCVTPLFAAAMQGHIDAVKVLIKASDHINSSPYAEINPMWAVAAMNIADLLNYAAKLDKQSEMEALIHLKENISEISVMDVALSCDNARLKDVFYRAHLEGIYDLILTRYTRINHDQKAKYGFSFPDDISRCRANNTLDAIDAVLNKKDELTTQNYDRLAQQIKPFLRGLKESSFPTLFQPKSLPDSIIVQLDSMSDLGLSAPQQEPNFAFKN